jgi:glutathione S-transferase
MAARLFEIHGSHPCMTVRAALDLKGVDYDVVELIPPLHVPVQRLLFGARTVPAIRLDGGERVSGSRPILRRLDELVPEPALLPADPAARAEVLRAEEWGDEVYQPIGRRLLWMALAACPEAMPSFQRGSRLPSLPPAVLRVLGPAVALAERRLHGADAGTARADLRALPRHLDRIDGWIAEGILHGAVLNAADLQIAATSRLLLTIADLRPSFHGRPAREHAMRVFPERDGAVPPGALPPAWLDEPQSAV